MISRRLVSSTPAEGSEPLAEMSFWDHLDVLRSVIIKALVVLVVAGIALFVYMPWIFDNVILAPCRPDFILYRLMDHLEGLSGVMPDIGTGDFQVHLINIQLASQFFIHMSASCWMALLLSFPIILYLLWTFISPGLYENERRGAVRAFLFGNVMFFLGVATGYFLVFPITLRFLAGYQLSALVPNQISLDSYMDTFITIVFMMGVLFELPLLAWLLGRMGILTRGFFNRFRRHAILGLLILAAVITPTGDPFTLAVVFVPIYLLWEFSALLVAPESVEGE